MTLHEAKYVLMTTFRKNGQGVGTPMWFAIDETDRIYMQTNAGSIKVKRLLNNSALEVCPSDARGRPLGEIWLGTGTLHSPDSDVAKKSLRLLARHYGWVFRIFNFGLWLFRRKLAYIEITLQGPKSQAVFQAQPPALEAVEKNESHP